MTAVRSLQNGPRGHKTGSLPANWAQILPGFFCLAPYGCESRAGECTPEMHSVLHGSFSWLFISRRGRLCRRWMFLRTARGTRSTCRFCAVVSWMEILIDFGSAIFSRTCWKSPGWGWCDVTPTLGHLICLIVSVIKILHVGGGESTGYQYFSWHWMIFWWSCANTANFAPVLAQLPFQQLLTNSLWKYFGCLIVFKSGQKLEAVMNCSNTIDYASVSSESEVIFMRLHLPKNMSFECQHCLSVSLHSQRIRWGSSNRDKDFLFVWWMTCQ